MQTKICFNNSFIGIYHKHMKQLFKIPVIELFKWWTIWSEICSWEFSTKEIRFFFFSTDTVEIRMFFVLFRVTFSYENNLTINLHWFGSRTPPPQNSDKITAGPLIVVARTVHPYITQMRVWVSDLHTARAATPRRPATCARWRWLIFSIRPRVACTAHGQ